MEILSNQGINTTILEQEPTLKTLFIKGTSETPEVHLDADEGVIRFSGRSLPEDAKTFYKDVKDWLHRYVESPMQGTHAIFVFDYFNTASSKMILEILDIIKEIEAQDDKLKIDWHYLEDDEDMLEAGEDFAEISELKFNYISYD